MKGQDSSDNNRSKALELSESFFRQEGRRPRILLGSFAKRDTNSIHIVSVSLADLGFDIDIAPFKSEPDQLILQAIENDVHGVLILSAKGDLQETMDWVDRDRKNPKETDIRLFLWPDTNEWQGRKEMKSKWLHFIPPDMSALQVGMFILEKL